MEQPGKIELVTTDPEVMERQVMELITSLGVTLTDVPRRLWHARKRAEHGVYLRSQMPVIDEEDFPKLKEYLVGDGFTLVISTMRAKEMLPLQRQIYVDKAVNAIAEHGVAESLKHIASTHVTVTRDGHIVDGHHRWLSAMLTEPDAGIPVMRASGTAEQTLKDFLAFSDAEGKQRNL